LDRGLSWQSPDKFKAIRLLGQEPLDAVDVPDVALVFEAAHVMDPRPDLTRADLRWFDLGADLSLGLSDEDDHEDQGESDSELEEKQAERDTDQLPPDLPAAFAELRVELARKERLVYTRRLMGRRFEEMRPRDETHAREQLLALVDRATGRVKHLLAAHEKRAKLDATDQNDRLAFDTSVVGEQVRRYELSCSRKLLRTLDLILRLRHAAATGAPARLPESGGSAIEQAGALSGVWGSEFREHEPAGEPVRSRHRTEPPTVANGHAVTPAVVSGRPERVAEPSSEPAPVQPVDAAAAHPFAPAHDGAGSESLLKGEARRGPVAAMSESIIKGRSFGHDGIRLTGERARKMLAEGRVPARSSRSTSSLRDTARVVREADPVGAWLARICERAVAKSGESSSPPVRRRKTSSKPLAGVGGKGSP
jgi:hypothetical protein